MLRFAAIALVAAVASGPFAGTSAPSVSLERPDQSAVLAASGQVMDLHYARDTEGDFAVRATFADGSDTPRTVVLFMGDGESAVLAVPGQPGAVFRFTRRGSTVTARAGG